MSIVFMFPIRWGAKELLRIYHPRDSSCGCFMGSCFLWEYVTLPKMTNQKMCDFADLNNTDILQDVMNQECEIGVWRFKTIFGQQIM